MSWRPSLSAILFMTTSAVFTLFFSSSTEQSTGSRTTSSTSISKNKKQQRKRRRRSSTTRGNNSRTSSRHHQQEELTYFSTPAEAGAAAQGGHEDEDKAKNVNHDDDDDVDDDHDDNEEDEASYHFLYGSTNQQESPGFYPFIVRARHRLSFDATIVSGDDNKWNTTISAGAGGTTNEILRGGAEERLKKDQSHDNSSNSSSSRRRQGHRDTSSCIPRQNYHDHFQDRITTALQMSSSSSGCCSSTLVKNDDDTMKSFAHFHELLVDSSSSPSSSSSNTKDDSKNSKNPDDSLSSYWTNHHNEDESMEQVNRKSTPVEKLLHQQVKHSFNSTYSSSDDQGDNDDEDEYDEDDSSCSTTCSDDTSTITMPTSNRITSTTTTTTTKQQQQQQQQQPIRQTNTNKQSSLQKEIINASRFSVWRSTYNSKIMPNQVILVRHGQSEGNVNEAIYAEKPDSEISLTKLGWEQAKMAGRALKQEIFNRQYGVATTAVNNGDKEASIHFIVSPYVRTMETFHGLVSAWCDPDVEYAHWENDHERKMLWYSRLKEMGITWHEDPRIREQDFGNYQEQHVIDKAKVERHKFGAFYYRFPNGESASDVYDRASTFLDSLWRSFDANRSQNYVLVTHGISVRVLLMRYFRYSIDQFYMIANPRNCEMIILGHDGKGRLQLDGRCDLELRENKNINKHKYKHKKKTTTTLLSSHAEEKNVPCEHSNIMDDATKEQDMVEVHGYKFYKRLRIVPDHHMRTRMIRLSYNG